MNTVIDIDALKNNSLSKFCAIMMLILHSDCFRPCLRGFAGQ